MFSSNRRGHRPLASPAEMTPRCVVKTTLSFSYHFRFYSRACSLFVCVFVSIFLVPGVRGIRKGLSRGNRRSNRQSRVHSAGRRSRGPIDSLERHIPARSADPPEPCVLSRAPGAWKNQRTAGGPATEATPLNGPALRPATHRSLKTLWRKYEYP